MKMENKLNENQIKIIIDWMNTWEQLRDTAIPVRFKEDFRKNEVARIKKPPIGAIPKWLWKEMRKSNILKAINKYYEKGLDIPKEWIEEFQNL